MVQSRSLPIDVLRGFAIVLVLFRHHTLWDPLQRLGWIGVDLFFVLSGYLVSGLLFTEYSKHGDIKPWRFLIRRGFKIYPTFYALLPLAVLINVKNDFFHPVGLISEVVFLQNYLFGFGWWPFTITWSLAVEEHFYFALSFALWLASRQGPLSSKRLPRSILFLMLTCLGLRLFSHHVFPLVLFGGVEHAHFTNTHFRFDALLCGVFISWCMCFERVRLEALVRRAGLWVIVLSIALLSFTPFVESTTSEFVMTWGFTCTYLAFGLMLSYVLVAPDRVPRNAFTRALAQVGQWSYPIYLVHALVLAWIMKHPVVTGFLGNSDLIVFPVYFFLSILLGGAVSVTWEQYFLRLRDSHFPARSRAN